MRPLTRCTLPTFALAWLMLTACGAPTVDDPMAEISSPMGLPVRQQVALATLDANPTDEAYLEALHNMMWRAGYTLGMREQALLRLEQHDFDQLQRNIRLRVPNLDNWGWLERLCEIIADRGWTEQTPALISSWARHVMYMTDYRERPEYAALVSLHGEGRVTDVVFQTFTETTEVSKQGLRLRCWDLLDKLGERDRLVDLVRSIDPAQDDLLLTDLHTAARDLGIVPETREEILWIRELRQPDHADFWAAARDARLELADRERDRLAMRDLPVLVSASIHEPELLTMPRSEIFSRLAAMLDDQPHHVHSSDHVTQEATRSRDIRNYSDELRWGDLVALHLAMRTMRVPQVVDHLFDFADRDHADESTEYGGLIVLDDRNRFEILEFPPRVREHDRKFIASNAMFKASYESLFHFHYHVQAFRNGSYAGPGYGDLTYADAVRSNCLVMTFVSADTMNVDYYRHDRVVIDLGEIRRPGTDASPFRMQLFPILVVAAVLAADVGLRLTAEPPANPGWAGFVIAWGPVLALWLAFDLWMRRARRQLLRGEIRRAIHACDIGGRLLRWGLLAAHVVALLVFGTLDSVRSVIGNVVLLDELLAVAPPIVGLVLGFVSQYPVERILRDATALERHTEGRSVRFPEPRGQWVLGQARVHVLLLLVPALIVIGLAEAIRVGAETWIAGDSRMLVADVSMLIAGAMVFVTVPLFARWLLGLVPLSAGSLRDDLVAVCARHRVRVREVYLWPTGESMINAAVMGLVAPLRIVMLTDSLLSSMTREETVAVMAHEIGHVRRQHLPWLVIVLMAVLVSATLVARAPMMAAQHWLVPIVGDDWQLGLETVIQIGTLIAALPLFGWISRRFERQADAFAVQHLSGLGVGSDDQRTTVSDDAVFSMCSALTRLSHLNMIDPARRDWRHGSIDWRRDYLRSLIGRPVAGLRIDRLMRSIKLASAILLVGATVSQVWLDSRTVPASPAGQAEVTPPVRTPDRPREPEST